MSSASRRKKIAALLAANRSAVRRKLTRTIEPEHADEALQEAFVRIVSKPPNEFENPVGYFYVTALNVARANHLKARTRVHAPERWPIDAQRAAGHEEFDLEGAFVEASERAKVRAAFGSLPERQQDIISLYFDDDQARKEIAKELGMTPRFVKRELLKAYGQLREVLR